MAMRYPWGKLPTDPFEAREMLTIAEIAARTPAYGRETIRRYVQEQGAYSPACLARLEAKGKANQLASNRKSCAAMKNNWTL